MVRNRLYRKRPAAIRATKPIIVLIQFRVSCFNQTPFRREKRRDDARRALFILTRMGGERREGGEAVRCERGNGLPAGVASQIEKIKTERSLSGASPGANARSVSFKPVTRRVLFSPEPIALFLVACIRRKAISLPDFRDASETVKGQLPIPPAFINRRQAPEGFALPRRIP